MYSRRTFLKISSGIIALLSSGLIFRNISNQKVNHILASASHEKLAISVSLSKKTTKLELMLDNKVIIKGIQKDRIGTNWQFISDKLLSDHSYKLQLISEGDPIYKPWNLKTFPSPDTKVENVSVMAFTLSLIHI